MKRPMETALWCDCETDAERAEFIRLGRAYATGVIASVVAEELADAYDRLAKMGGNEMNDIQRDIIREALKNLPRPQIIDELMGLSPHPAPASDARELVLKILYREKYGTAPHTGAVPYPQYDEDGILDSIAEVTKHDAALFATRQGESPSVDDLLLQEICSLREKLKIAVAAIKADNPTFDDTLFLHRLNAVDLDQLMEELNGTTLSETAPEGGEVEIAHTYRIPGLRVCTECSGQILHVAGCTQSDDLLKPIQSKPATPTAREVFTHIASRLNDDQADGSMSITLDDELIAYLDNWRKQAPSETAPEGGEEDDGWQVRSDIDNAIALIRKLKLVSRKAKNWQADAIDLLKRALSIVRAPRPEASGEVEATLSADDKTVWVNIRVGQQYCSINLWTSDITRPVAKAYRALLARHPDETDHG